MPFSHLPHTPLQVWWESTTADWARGLKANSPFYQSHLVIGSEFGSATKAYFMFFSSMVRAGSVWSMGM